GQSVARALVAGDSVQPGWPGTGIPEPASRRAPRDRADGRFGGLSVCSGGLFRLGSVVGFAPVFGGDRPGTPCGGGLPCGRALARGVLCVFGAVAGADQSVVGWSGIARQSHRCACAPCAAWRRDQQLGLDSEIQLKLSEKRCLAMEVILLEKTGRLGNIGDRVKVKAGYGRNYLIPQGKAVFATADNIAQFEARRAELEATAAERLAAAQSLAERISQLDGLTLSAVAGEGEIGRASC